MLMLSGVIFSNAEKNVSQAPIPNQSWTLDFWSCNYGSLAVPVQVNGNVVTGDAADLYFAGWIKINSQGEHNLIINISNDTNVYNMYHYKVDPYGNWYLYDWMAYYC